jgi:hypothetical protein
MFLWVLLVLMWLGGWYKTWLHVTWYMVCHLRESVCLGASMCTSRFKSVCVFASLACMFVWLMVWWRCLCGSGGDWLTNWCACDLMRWCVDDIALMSGWLMCVLNWYVGVVVCCCGDVLNWDPAFEETTPSQDGTRHASTPRHINTTPTHLHTNTRRCVRLHTPTPRHTSTVSQVTSPGIEPGTLQRSHTCVYTNWHPFNIFVRHVDCCSL